MTETPPVRSSGDRPTVAGRAPRRAPLVRCGNFLFRYRKWVLAPVLLLMFVGLRPILPRGSPRLDRWLDLVGLAIALSGQGLRAAVIGYAYVRRGGLSGRVHADDLVTEGIFRHARNPLYLGNILILLGLLIVFNNPWAYLAGLPFVLFIYVSIVAAEECYLTSRFGERYAEYCRHVNRWLPDPRGLSWTLAGLRFNWRRLVIKEYGSAYAWLATAVLLLADEAHAYSIPARERRYLAELATSLAFLTACWAAARFAKKRRLLTETPPAPPEDGLAAARP